MSDTECRPSGLIERIDIRAFNKILRLGFDPAYTILIAPCNRVVLSRNKKSITSSEYKIALYCDDYINHRTKDGACRIIAKTTHGCNNKSWIVGLYIGLLRRQIKEGSESIKAWSFEKILDIEKMHIGLLNRNALESWTSILICKDDGALKSKEVVGYLAKRES